MASMDWDDYLRHEAAMYRQLAEKSENVFGKQELLDLAVVCEEVAILRHGIPTSLGSLGLSSTASRLEQITKPRERGACPAVHEN